MENDVSASALVAIVMCCEGAKRQNKNGEKRKMLAVVIIECVSFTRNWSFLLSFHSSVFSYFLFVLLNIKMKQ